MFGNDEIPKNAVVLLSGGLDSTTCLAIAQSKGYACHCLSFRYGQRHSAELDAAQSIAEAYGATKHLILNLELDQIGGSALTTDTPVPKERSDEQIGHGVPITYVPARNTIFLSYALAWAEVACAADIFIGVNALDYSGYPDCRSEYIAAFEKMANLATAQSTEKGIRVNIHTPLIDMTKAQIIETGMKLGVDYGLTHSCYDPTVDGKPCGRCDSCILRRKGFDEAGFADPLEYAS